MRIYVTIDTILLLPIVSQFRVHSIIISVFEYCLASSQNAIKQ